MSTNANEFPPEDLFDYVNGLLDKERAAAIHHAALGDEELAAKIAFFQLFGDPTVPIDLAEGAVPRDFGNDDDTDRGTRRGGWGWRKRSVFAAAGMLVLAAAVGIAITTVGLSRELDRLQQARDEAQSRAASLQDEVAKVRKLQGEAQERIEDLQRQLREYQRTIDKLLQERQTMSGLLEGARQAATPDRVVRDQFARFCLTFGRTRLALSEFKAVFAITEAELDKKPDDLDAMKKHATAAQYVGRTCRQLEDREEARTHFITSLTLRTKVFERASGATKDPAELHLATSYQDLANLARFEVRGAEACQFSEEAIEHLRSLWNKGFPNEVASAENYAVELINYGVGLAMLPEGEDGGRAKAQQVGLQAMSLLEATRPKATAETTDGIDRRIAICSDLLGDISLALDEKEKHYRAAVTIRNRLLANAPVDAIFARDQYVSLLKLGELLSERQQYEEAEAWLKQAVDVAERLRGRDDAENAGRRRDRDRAMAGLKIVYVRKAASRGDHQAAYAAAEDIVRFAGEIESELYYAAAGFAICAGHLPAGSLERTKCEERVLECLRRAVRGGFKDYFDFGHNSAFESLRENDEFQHILTDGMSAAGKGRNRSHPGDE